MPFALARLWAFVLLLSGSAASLLAQTFTPPPGAIPPNPVFWTPDLLPYSCVDEAAMDAWPVDREIQGRKLAAESVFNTEDSKHKSLWNYNIWPNRAILSVEQSGSVARAEVPWRRSKLFIRLKGLKLVDARTRKEIRDARLVSFGQERCVLEFLPTSGPGCYELYYGAYEDQPRFTPSADWLKLTQSTKPVLAVAERIEARSPLDNFWPMEVVATASETAALLAKHPAAPYLVFAEDRHRPIKMLYDLPVSWAMLGPSSEITLRADRNEYRVFQLGIWACRAELADVKTSCTELRSGSGASIPAEAVQCLTTESRIRSLYIQKPPPTHPVPQGQTRPLWFGISLPENVQPGEYIGTISVAPPNQPSQLIKLKLSISNTVVPERGDHDLWRLARLRWLESDVGVEEKIYPPFQPLRVDRKNRALSSWGHTVRLNAFGFPEAVRREESEILKAPFALTAAGVRWSEPRFEFTEVTPGHANWSAQSRAGNLKLRVNGRMEFDGIMVIDLGLSAKSPETARDLRLAGSWTQANSWLASGLGYRGRREGDRLWHAGPRGYTAYAPQVWLGSVRAGLAFHTWDSSPWQDATHMDAATVKDDQGNAALTLNFGVHEIKPDKPWQMRFVLQPTPVKPADPRHWQMRYVHRGGSFWPAENDTPQSYLTNNCKRLEEVANLHARRLNLHDWWGPVFNYAWQWERPDNLSRLTSEAHKRGLFVKAYSSGRLLSNLTPEFWALLPIGSSASIPATVNPDSKPYYQDAWHLSHLPDCYRPDWPRLDGHMGNEHTFHVSNGTRTGNFYLETMRYMTRFFGVDGAYWDGADGSTLGHREMARRLWAMHQEINPQAMTDAHHGITLLTSPITDYSLCFPFIDSIWHGEGFPYDKYGPWDWLTEISGIPFNLPSEMLSGEPQLARGMLFGLWPRAGWAAGEERQQKLWDFFDRFAIQDSTMRGFWDGAGGVTLDRPDIYTTSFVHDRNGVLLVVGSWHPPVAYWVGKSIDVSLALDRQRLKLPQGSLQACDILTGEQLDLDKPVQLDERISGRLIYISTGVLPR
jgi:hypothetical protein